MKKHKKIIRKKCEITSSMQLIVYTQGANKETSPPQQPQAAANESERSLSFY